MALIVALEKPPNPEVGAKGGDPCYAHSAAEALFHHTSSCRARAAPGQGAAPTAVGRKPYLGGPNPLSRLSKQVPTCLVCVWAWADVAEKICRRRRQRAHKPQPMGGHARRRMPSPTKPKQPSRTQNEALGVSQHFGLLNQPRAAHASTASTNAPNRRESWCMDRRVCELSVYHTAPL